MDTLLNNAGIERLAELIAHQVLDSAMLTFYAFTLVVVRMSGLMVVGPLFGQSLVPANLRVLLVVALSVLVTPLLQDQVRVGFERLDTDHDGRLTRAEVPDHLRPRFERLLQRSGHSNRSTLTAAEFYQVPEIPRTLIDYAWIVAQEFALGFVLGLGVLTILSGLQLAGQLIDQQTGLALGEVFNPALEIEGSVSSQFLYLLGVVVFLLWKPLSGHLVMLSARLEKFQTLPIGDAVLSPSIAGLLQDILQQSCVLAIQVAAPILATMSLVALAMGFLGHTVPQINILVIGFAVRVLVSLLVLAVTLSGLGQEIVDTVSMVMNHLQLALTALP